MGAKKFLKFVLNSLWDLILNDVANLFGGSLIGIISIVIVICLIGLLWILRLSIFSIPIYILLIPALGGIVIAMGIIAIPGIKRQLYWSGRHKVLDFYWDFQLGKLIDGPFCIHCECPIEEFSGDLDSRFHEIMIHQDQVVEHSCGKVIPQIPDMVGLKENVQAAVLLHIKFGKSVEDSMNKKYFS